MDTDNRNEKQRQAVGVDRRTVLRHAGTGLLLGTGVSGVAAAKGPKRGRSGTAGRPTVVGSTPSCETLHVEYVQGNPPLSVRIEGPEAKQADLDDDHRSVNWSVTPGEYELTATPGRGGSNGSTGVVVEGSPVTVAACPPATPDDAEPQGLSVTATCTASDGANVSYTVTNPTDQDVTLTVVISGSLSYEIETDVPAESSEKVPESGVLTANGEWTHEFTATGPNGDTVTLNEEDVWTNTPDCS